MPNPKFDSLTRGEIARKFISRAQKELLEEFFGQGVEGAQARIKDFRLPNGLTRETLEAYQEIAERVIAEGIDTIGVQALRLELTKKALAQIKG
jgi:hypothetical protein